MARARKGLRPPGDGRGLVEAYANLLTSSMPACVRTGAFRLEPGLRLFCRPLGCYAQITPMLKPLKLIVHAITGLLLISLSAITAAQALSGPQTQPAQAGPPTGPGQTPPDRRLPPTGIAANGGSLAHDLYTNTIYGFSLKTPPGWVVIPLPGAGDTSSQGQSAGPELAKGAQPNRILLLMSENARMKRPFERKSIQILATRTETKTAEDFLLSSQKTVKEKQMAVEYLNAPREVTINKQKLWWNKMKMNTAGGPQVANQYVVMQGPILLQFFLVSPDEAGLKSLQPTIESLNIQLQPGVTPTAPVKRARPRKKTAKPAQ